VISIPSASTSSLLGAQCSGVSRWPPTQPWTAGPASPHRRINAADDLPPGMPFKGLQMLVDEDQATAVVL
jgi:hypothetical protein